MILIKFLVITKDYKQDQFYYLIKHVRSCVFLCLNKYKIVGKGWVKCAKWAKSY